MRLTVLFTPILSYASVPNHLQPGMMTCYEYHELTVMIDDGIILATWMELLYMFIKIKWNLTLLSVFLARGLIPPPTHTL